MKRRRHRLRRATDLRHPSANEKLPISVIIATKDEAENLPRCLSALEAFDQIIVVDSASQDNTVEIAQNAGCLTLPFIWNGQYPKKRQFCLDYLSAYIRHDWVFFVDADEVITQQLIDELRQIGYHDQAVETAGYFIRGRYLWQGKPLRFGLQNNKLALLNRRDMEFPVIDDLDIHPGMGEMEGHYQPVLKKHASARRIGQIKAPLLHEACNNLEKWHERHQRYAHWEDEMDKRQAWPTENHPTRQKLKTLFRALPPWAKALSAFCHSYIFKLGLLDGKAGLTFAALRAQYYWR